MAGPQYPAKTDTDPAYYSRQYSIIVDHSDWCNQLLGTPYKYALRQYENISSNAPERYNGDVELETVQ